jgi:pyruvate/2-oxoglutarate dehydrogenase complex dihydrolipoamide acyltransferase (E2) component
VKTEGRRGYTVVPFPWARAPIVDSLRVARRKLMIQALVEVDVTAARAFFADHRRATGESLSFTGFTIACVAQAVEEHPLVQAYRHGARRLIVFDDVDVCTLVEHDVGAGKVATPLVIRAANRKTFREIHHEIRSAQAVGIGGPRTVRLMRLYPYLPRLLRTAFWRAFDHFPRLKARIGGTVVVTALSMFGSGVGWGIPITDYTLAFTLGGIAEKPAVVDGRIEVRQILCLTISADHEVVDGAPLARFLHTLKDLIERGYGLDPGLDVASGDAHDGHDGHDGTHDVVLSRAP